jgi:predicted protein tyrosine phosphatase
MFGRNLHVVIPGRVYRSGQLSGSVLEEVIAKHGIRTVVNLRGCCDPLPWYLEEARATHHLEVAQEDVSFSAGRLPSTHEIRRLVEILDRTEYPILLHCFRGADRTGLAAAVVLLLDGNVTWDKARSQLGLRYGHLALGRPAYLDKFFELYREWLADQQFTHSSTRFRHWLERDYCPAEGRSVVEPLYIPAQIQVGQPAALRVRVHNCGIRSWQLRSGTNAGIHVGFILWDPEGKVAVNDRSGLFNAEILTGSSVEVTIPLPALPRPGTYRLLVDMVDEQHCWFYQVGSEPLEQDIEVQ